MAVALVDDLFAVRLPHDRAGQELRRIRAEAHRAALVDDLALLVHEVDHRMRRVRVELAGVRTGEPARVARELDRRAVQPEAQPEERDVLHPGEAGRGDLALDAAEPEAAGDHDAVEVAQAAFGEQALGVVGGDPVDLHARRTRSRRAAAPRRPRGTRRAG